VTTLAESPEDARRVLGTINDERRVNESARGKSTYHSGNQME
jgi:hypothetical protein